MLFRLKLFLVLEISGETNTGKYSGWSNFYATDVFAVHVNDLRSIFALKCLYFVGLRNTKHYCTYCTIQSYADDTATIPFQPLRI